MILPKLKQLFDALNGNSDLTAKALSGIDLHTKVFCKCGMRFNQNIAQLLPPQTAESFFVSCPDCGNEVEYAYEFKAECKCGNLVFEHFAVNNGNMNQEYYPRSCKSCGKEFILYQRRTK